MIFINYKNYKRKSTIYMVFISEFYSLLFMFLAHIIRRDDNILIDVQTQNLMFIRRHYPSLFTCISNAKMFPKQRSLLLYYCW